jgi:hypothetical protein
MTGEPEPQLSDRQIRILMALADGLARLGPAVQLSCWAPGCQFDATMSFDLGGVAGLPQVQLCTLHARQHIAAVDRSYVPPPI